MKQRTETCEMAGAGKLLILIGLLFLAVGAALMFLGRTSLPVGRLPGDLLYRGKNTTFYFPLTTSILLSLILSLLVWAIGKMRH